MCQVPRITLHEGLKSATHPATMRRAWATSLMVGTVLIAINHGHAIIAGQITQKRIFQMSLTLIVPMSFRPSRLSQRVMN